MDLVQTAIRPIFLYSRGRRTGVNYPKWGKNEILGGNEDSIDINKII
jgi:hypothetical protein